MRAGTILRLVTGGYMLLFFLFLFGPLMVMGTTAFNTPGYPQALPFEGFTLHWFGALLDDVQLMRGIRNSVLIGVGVICMSVPIGLAGAILLTQLYPRARSLFYTVVVSPVLTPGVIIGISTLVFWDRIGTAADVGIHSFLYSGFFLSILGQSTFISAYCMLIFLARLQRFDRTLEEAALDLGASHTQVFRQILVPFLRPAILSSAVLAFLASFENYNTTIFTISADSTLTTVLAGKVRMGTTPALSALAMLIVGLTLAGAILYEIYRRREERREKARSAVAALAEAAA
jgi:spermidine/putrescine transport system permease protein